MRYIFYNDVSSVLTGGGVCVIFETNINGLYKECTWVNVLLILKLLTLVYV